MKNVWFLTLFLAGLLTSCGSSDDNENDLEDNFHIEGQIKGASNQILKVQAQTDQGTVNVAETTTSSDGSFELDGNIPSLGVYSITVGNDASNTIVIPMDVDDQITINGDVKTFAIYADISGPKWAKPYMDYKKRLDAFNQKYLSTDGSLKDPSTAKPALTAFNEAVLKQVKKDPSNPVNIVLASHLFPNQEEGFAGYDKRNFEALEAMSKAYQSKYPGSPITNMLVANIGTIQQQYDQYVSSTSGTASAPEISLPDMNGKQHRLSDLKGKVVLVDFWASWCGPCRKENPNVVRLYNKYRSKGFEIFSVSLDQDKAAWKQAIEKDGLNWPNHVSDLMGWQSSVVQQYGISGIPHTVLLNKEGKIIGIGLRGEQLEQKLEEVLAKN